MSRSRDNASAVTTVPSGVGRNMVINGGMNVAQRSASVTGLGAAAGYFTLDRWKSLFSATAGRLTQTQTADGPNGISANCLKLDCTTADTSIAAGEYFLLQHKFEGHNVQRIGKGVAGAKEVTVSFYVKANAAFDFGCELFDVTAERQCTKLFSTTTDWVRHEITFPADVDDGSSPFNDDNSNELELNFWLHSGSTFTSGTLNAAAFNNLQSQNRATGIDSFFSSTDNNFFLTGVQMEVGPVATEFEQEDISTTLGKCQRYCQDLTPPTGGDTAYIGDGYAHTTTIVIAFINFIAEFRATPTITLTGTPGDYSTYESGAARAVTSLAINGPSTNGTSINFVCSGGGLTVGEGAGVYLTADNTHRSIIESEL